MRKFLATLLALTVVMSLGAVAFADRGPAAGTNNIETESGSAEIDVSLSATISERPDTYYVTVEWESMAFTYTENGADTWNHTSHTWTESGGTWSGGGSGGSGSSSTITITNHSSVGVTVGGSYAAKSSGQYDSGTPYNGVTLTFTGPASTSLGAGTQANASSPSDNQTTASVSVAGNPEETISGGVVGTVTITISEATA